MKGVYCLIINIKKNINIKIGALGKINFKKGIYVYVGSAQNNLEKRILRHYSHDKKVRWHIDYLLENPNVEIKKAVFKESSKEEECKIAKFLAKLEIPIKGFGSSDCKCPSHLFKLGSLKNILKLNLNEIKIKGK